ncbi:MAG: hypothetical protein IJ230_00660 [Clostridia bacterium]|nr:hypothetical protein [Clostridia bacterium]
MNRKWTALLSLLLMLSMALGVAACSTEDSELNTATIEADQFKYTLQSATTEVVAKDLDPDSPFRVTLSIEYLGDQDSIDLWCVGDLGTITMENGSGQAMLQDEHFSRDTSRVTIEKGKPYEITWTGAQEYKEYDGIPTGQYKVVAYLNFSTDSNYDSIQENTLDLSLNVK